MKWVAEYLWAVWVCGCLQIIYNSGADWKYWVTVVPLIFILAWRDFYRKNHKPKERSQQ